MFFSFSDWVGFKLSETEDLWKAAILKYSHQSNLNLSGIGVSLEFSSKFLISLEVTECIGVFDVSDKRVILTDLDIVISELILIMLVLCAFHLVFVGVFRVLVEVGLSLTVDADSEELATIVVCPGGSDRILNYFECFVDCCKCIEISAFYSWLKCSFL